MYKFEHVMNNYLQHYVNIQKDNNNNKNNILSGS